MKNGQLWYNTRTRRVERVIATGPRVCATSYHREDLVGWPNSYMRLATSAEVIVPAIMPDKSLTICQT